MYANAQHQQCELQSSLGVFAAIYPRSQLKHSEIT